MAALTTEEEIRSYLNLQGVPQFIDKFIQRLVKEHPVDYKATLKELLDREVRNRGKGAKAMVMKDVMMSGGDVSSVPKSMKYSASSAKQDEDYGIPAYCKKDPTIKPSEQAVTSKGVVTYTPTRAKINNPATRKPHATTVEARYNYTAERCRGHCKKIEALCEQQKKPFFNNEFWFGKRNTMYPKGAPADCTVTEPKEVMRLFDLFKGAPLFDDGVSSNDIVQGALGDCFFIGAVSALCCCTAKDVKPIQRLFVYDNSKWGIYGLVFFKNGAWEWVIVDDYVAVQRDRQGTYHPQYASFGGSAEIWPLILEKAYAQMHFC